MNRKIVVPEGMLEAVRKALCAGWFSGVLNLSANAPGTVYRMHSQVALDAALLWLSENPPLPTEAQCNEMWRAADNNGDRYCQEWVRRMFLAPEPEVPQEIKDLQRICRFGDEANAEIRTVIAEAFRRGQESKR